MRPAIEEYVGRNPMSRLHFAYVAVRRWPLCFGWTVGSALQYVLWLSDSSRVAARLDHDQPFDFVQHASYGTLLGGTFLWRLGRPLAFGPVGGGQTAPRQFLKYFGRMQRSERLRTFVVTRLWYLSWHARRAVSMAAAVLVTNHETGELARRMGARHVEVVRDVGIDGGFAPSEMPNRDGRDLIRVLWLGRFLERKGLKVAVEAFEQVPSETNVVLEILGVGYNEQNEVETRSYLASRSLSRRIEVKGPVPYREIGEVYRRADIFVFTGLRDSGGGQVLEAMAYGLPIICLDHQGAAELVGDCGARIPVKTPAQTVAALGEAIDQLARDPARRRALGEAAFERARHFTWDQKARQVLAAVGVADAEPRRNSMGVRVTRQDD